MQNVNSGAVPTVKYVLACVCKRLTEDLELVGMTNFRTIVKTSWNNMNLKNIQCWWHYVKIVRYWYENFIKTA